MVISSPPAHAPFSGATAPAPARRRRPGRWVVPGAVLALVAVALPMTGRMRRSAPPPDVGTVKPTANGLYRVLLAPERAPIPMRQLHRWTVRVEPAAASAATASPATASAAAATPVTVAVDGGMPQHGHGLPTQPRVTGRLPDGRFVVDGMKFSMPGWWELRLRVAGPAGTDSVTFNLTL